VKEREHLTYLIGNLTLLTSRRNKEIANADFTTKKDKVLSLNGNNSLPINSNVIGYKQWNKEAILRRNQELVQKAAEVMSL
jgi:phosphopantothenate synthetase